ncbi:MAG: hypothetical protein ACTS4T_01905 [Candidatus Hodgkinia cicadicola]
MHSPICGNGGSCVFAKTNGQIGGKSNCDELPETPFNGTRRLRRGVRT